LSDAIVAAKGAPPSRLAAVVSRGLREGALIVFGALALVLLLALVSFDPQDPGFTNTGEPGRIANLIGPIGAWVADVFLAVFGVPAFLFPVMLGLFGWALFRPPASDAASRASLVFRLAGFALTLAPAPGLRRCILPHGTTPTPPAASSATWSVRVLHRDFHSSARRYCCWDCGSRAWHCLPACRG